MKVVAAGLKLKLVADGLSDEPLARAAAACTGASSSQVSAMMQAG